MKVKNIETSPDYISSFLRENMDQLIKIHSEGKTEYGEGCLGFNCSKSENRMDVFYMDESKILQNISKETWETIKSTMNEKRLFLVNDLELKSIFLIYI